MFTAVVTGAAFSLSTLGFSQLQKTSQNNTLGGRLIRHINGRKDDIAQEFIAEWMGRMHIADRTTALGQMKVAGAIAFKACLPFCFKLSVLTAASGIGHIVDRVETLFSSQKQKLENDIHTMQKTVAAESEAHATRIEQHTDLTTLLDKDEALILTLKSKINALKAVDTALTTDVEALTHLLHQLQDVQKEAQVLSFEKIQESLTLIDEILKTVSSRLQALTQASPLPSKPLAALPLPIAVTS